MSSQFDSGYNKKRSYDENLRDFLNSIDEEGTNSRKYHIDIDESSIGPISAEQIISLRKIGIQIKNIWVGK